MTLQIQPTRGAQSPMANSSESVAAYPIGDALMGAGAVA
jgi:hypothetical protein